MSQGPSAQIRIRSALPNPERTGHWDRWVVDCDVLAERNEAWPEGLDRIQLLVHSPTKSFAIAVDELPRQCLRIELEAPVGEVYQGLIRVLPEELP